TILRKSKITYELLETPGRDRIVGSYLILLDSTTNRKLLLQIIDVNYLSIPGEIEEIIRISKREDSYQVFEEDENLKKILDELMDSRILTCKVRAAFSLNDETIDFQWAPSRLKSRIYEPSVEELNELITSRYAIPVKIGDDLQIDLNALDGGLTLIVGKKGSGKSNLSKMLVAKLMEHGGRCIVFDINGEYEPAAMKSRFLVLKPGVNMFLSISNLGKELFIVLMETIMGLPPSSVWELRRILDSLENRNMLNLKNLWNEVVCGRFNDLVKEALVRRITVLRESGLFSDTIATDLDGVLKEGSNRVLVINLKGLTKSFRQLIVETMLNKIVRMLEAGEIRPLFLFAEEAQSYLGEKTWEDYITRMRHIGLSVVFITNEPDSLMSFVYRQADNCFIFNLVNENDLNYISRMSKIDAESLISLVPTLPVGRCIAFGNATGNIPAILSIRRENVFGTGETRRVLLEAVPRS
ncbi:MAG: ATP-binding protein, partial [Thermoproteota archaeon]